MYGKLINNNLIPAPAKLVIGDTQVWNAPASDYLAQGWLPVVFTDEPGDAPEGFYYESDWEQDGNEIVQTWTLVERAPDDIDAEEALSILLGGDLE